MPSIARALVLAAFALLSTALFVGTGSAQQGQYSGSGGYMPPGAGSGDSTTVYGGSTAPAPYGQPAYTQPPPYQASPPTQAAPVYSAPPAYAPAPAAPPPAGPDLVQVLQNAGQFQTFLQLVDTAGFSDALHRGGPYTVFAPTEAAFGRLPPGTVQNMLNSRSTAISFVRFHLLQGEVRVADMLRGGQRLQSLQGNTFEFSTRTGRATVNGAPIILPDLVAQNGIVQGLAAFALPVYPGALEGRREPGSFGRSSAGSAGTPMPSPPVVVPTPSRSGSYPASDGGGPAFYR